MRELILHKSFDSLIEREYNANETLSKNKIENGFALPDLYKNFVESYHTGKDSLRKEYYYDEQEELQLPSIGYYFISNNFCISIEDFVDVYEAIDFWQSDAEQFQSNGKGIMRIAYTNDAGGGGVYIGMKEENFGEIFFATWDTVNDNSVTKIANNINEFIECIESVGF